MNKKYENRNGEVIIIWRPHLCRHLRICVKTSPEAYIPDERPWINAYNATTRQLIHNVNHSLPALYHSSIVTRNKKGCLIDNPSHKKIMVKAIQV